MPTKSDAQQSFFIFVQDTNNGKIKRIAVPGDLQVGLLNNPASLELLGRLTVSTCEFIATASNKGSFQLSDHNTISVITTTVVPDSGRLLVQLPTSPKVGQLHFIKDGSGTAGGYPIDILSPSGVLIDGETLKTITDSYGTIALFWHGTSWKVLINGGSGGSGSGASTSASYLTVNAESGLTSERRLLSSSNISTTDNGAGSTFVLNLTDTGVVAGSYSNPTLTVDAKGRISTIASSIPPNPSASYIVVSSESSLPNERVLSASLGIQIIDAGANSTISIGIKNSEIATLTGSTFSGQVVVQGGLSGSLQQLSSGLSYLVAGTNVTINSQSNGQVIISATPGADSPITGSWADVSGSYITITNTGSLPNERSLAVSSDMLLADGGAGGSVTIGLSAINSFKLTQIPDVSASYITIASTGSLPNERTLAVSSDLSLSLGAAGGSATIALSPINSFKLTQIPDVSASYVVISTTGSLPNERALSVSSDLALSDGGAGSSATLSLSPINSFKLTQIPDVSASYITIASTGSLPNERTLTAGTGLIRTDDGAGNAVTLSINDNIVATVSGTRFTGPVSASSGLSGSLQQVVSGLSYLVAGTNVTITSQSNGQIRISSTSGTPASVPIFSLALLAGVVTTNTATSGTKQSIGSIYFNASLLNTFSGTKQFMWRAIVDSSETPVSAAIDLYDINGIVGFPPGIITGSIMSSSNLTMTQIEFDLTSQLSSVTGSGIFESRLWKTVSGSLTSSVSCRNARLDILFT